jgi:hypothetical protein
MDDGTSNKRLLKTTFRAHIYRESRPAFQTLQLPAMNHSVTNDLKYSTSGTKTRNLKTYCVVASIPHHVAHHWQEVHQGQILQCITVKPVRLSATN